MREGPGGLWTRGVGSVGTGTSHGYTDIQAQTGTQAQAQAPHMATETYRHRLGHIAHWALQAQTLRSSDVNLHRDKDAQDKGGQGTGTQSHTRRRLTVATGMGTPLHRYMGSCSTQRDVVV